jgi:hypothetical protein
MIIVFFIDVLAFQLRQRRPMPRSSARNIAP